MAFVANFCIDFHPCRKIDVESTDRKKLKPQIRANFTATIFMEVTILRVLNCTKIDEVIWEVQVEMCLSTGRNAFKTESKVWLPLDRFSRMSPLHDGFLESTAVSFFMKILKQFSR
jgi:hypothetical protein